MLNTENIPISNLPIKCIFFLKPNFLIFCKAMATSLPIARVLNTDHPYNVSTNSPESSACTRVVRQIFAKRNMVRNKYSKSIE